MDVESKQFQLRKYDKVFLTSLLYKIWCDTSCLDLISRFMNA